jgi:flagellar basal body-associated protein FliL
MDLLPLLLAIFIALVVIGGLIWYLFKQPRTPKKRSRRKRPARSEPSFDKITAATERNLSKAETMEEVFAAGREGLNQIKKQIKESKPLKRKDK